MQGVTLPHRYPRMLCRWLAAVACLALVASAGLQIDAQSQPPMNTGLTVLPVRTDIYMIAGAGSNVVVHIGRDGVIVADTGTADKANLVLAEIKRLTTKPIRMIINTSADPDHVGGNEVLSRAGQPIAANIPGGGNADMRRNYAPILAEERVLFRMSAPTGQQSPYPAAALPTSTFAVAAGDKQRKMYLNGEPTQVIAQPAAHTDGDSVVYFRRADVLVTGDVFDMTRFPVIDSARGGSIQGVIDSLNRLIEMSFDGTPLPYHYPDDGTLIVPGHGQLCAQNELVDYRDMVTIIRDRVQALITEGKSLQQIQEANPTEGWRREYGSDSGTWTTAMFVDAVYNGLTGVTAMRACSFGIGARFAATLLLALCVAVGVGAQGRGGAPPPPPQGKAAAPLDPTGYWVAVVTRDWRWRMMTPPKGDFSSIPVNDAAKKVADSWNPSKDEAQGEQCRAYGAAGLMRIPTRLHITWQDDMTLRVDTDAGQQTRLLRFGPAAARTSTKPSWQGDSTARWYGLGRGGSQDALKAGRIEVVTRNMRPGYLMRNGLPYSAGAVMTEYWSFFKEPDGSDYLVITTRIVDPMYLRTPYQSAPSFKRESDGAKWDPSPCSAEG